MFFFLLLIIRNFIHPSDAAKFDSYLSPGIGHAHMGSAIDNRRSSVDLESAHEPRPLGHSDRYIPTHRLY